MKRINIELYNNYGFEIKDYEADYNELTERERKCLSLESFAYRLLELDYSDLIANLVCSDNNGPCVVIGVLDLWNGKHPVSKCFNSVVDAIQNCVNNMDYIIIKQVNGHLFLQGMHHDGTNRFSIHLLNNKGINTINGDKTKSCYHKAIVDYVF